MAKHSLGKHGKGKHASKAAGAHAPWASKEEKAPAGQPSSEEAKEASPAAEDEGAASEEDAAAPSEAAEPTPAAPSGDDATEGEASSEPAAPPVTPPGEPAASASADATAEMPRHGAPSESEDAAKPAKQPHAKHAAPAHGPKGAEADSATAAAGVAAAEAAEPRGLSDRAKKVLLICGGVLLGLLLIAYLAGAFVFSNRFYPNTRAADFDLSLETPDAVQEQLSDALKGYAFEVEGYGVDMLFTAEDIAMDIDPAEISQAMRDSMNPWLWPLQVWGDHDETQALAATCATDQIVEKVKPVADELNVGATLPTNATIAFDADKGSFAIVPETYGTALDPEAIAEEVALGIMTFQPVIQLDSQAMVQPTVFKDDPRLEAACELADTLVTANVDIMLDGQVAGTVDPARIASWIVLDEDQVPSVDDGKLVAWTDDLVARNSTLEGERTYTRADGKVITVAGGSYGWAFDGAGLADQVRSAVTQGTKGTIELPVQQSAARVVADGHPDWPTRYVDVDLSEQYARFYGDDGSIIWEAPIVSGKPGGWETPTGVWMINSKASPTMLIGAPLPGTNKPEYETQVQYWMPFVGNSIGFHDATWQSSFGGNRWCTGAGSHGCVNLSYGSAEALYGIIGSGDVVVVHY